MPQPSPIEPRCKRWSTMEMPDRSHFPKVRLRFSMLVSGLIYASITPRSAARAG